MDYKILRYLPVNKVQIGSDGVLRSLCNSCKTRDCSNRIEYRYVSYMGVMEKQRLWISWEDIYLVLLCILYYIPYHIF